MVPGAGLEPAREFNFPTDFRTTTAFAATCFCMPLWSGLSLHPIVLITT